MNREIRSAKSRVLLPSGSIIDRVRNEACRQDFVSFIELVFNLLSPGRPFRMNWHILAVAHVLEQVRLGKIKRLIINLPPRFLKSLISSVARSRSYQTRYCHFVWIGASYEICA